MFGCVFKHISGLFFSVNACVGVNLVCDLEAPVRARGEYKMLCVYVYALSVCALICTVNILESMWVCVSVCVTVCENIPGRIQWDV